MESQRVGHDWATELNWTEFRLQGKRQWQPAPVLLPRKSHGWRSLVGYSSWGREESDKTKLLHFHFSLSCIGGRNGNPLQCSCLENPRDGGAGGLPSMGSHRVGHDWSNLAAAAAVNSVYWKHYEEGTREWRENGQEPPVLFDGHADTYELSICLVLKST